MPSEELTAEKVEEVSSAPDSDDSKRPSLLRKIYDWTLHWAVTPYGLVALCVLAFAESSFFPIPPDVLLIAVVSAAPALWLRAGLLCTVFSVVGGMAGYAIGHFAWGGLGPYFFRYIPGFTHASFALFQQWYDKWGITVVFVAGFSPVPYKVFTISSGVAGMNFPAFVGASILSRGGRFMIVSGLLRLFGPPIKSFIEKYFNILSIVFVILLIGGFIALGMLH